MTTQSSKKGHGPYRSRSGVIFGVCKGLSEYFNFSLFWTRIITVGILVFSGLWPIGAIYIILALLLKPEPVVPFTGYEDEEFYNSYSSSRSMALKRLKRSRDNLDRRLRRLEDIITARDYDWERRLRQGK